MSDLKATLQSLQTELAKDLLKRIKDRTATAADLNVARAFLKDNNIESLPIPGTPMAGLAGSLTDKLPFAGTSDFPTQ